MKTCKIVQANTAKLTGGDTLQLPCQVNYYYITSDCQAIEAVEEIIQFLTSNKTYALDIETTGLDPFLDELISLQIGLTNNQQYIFDIRYVSPSIIFPVLNFDCWKVGHNLKFDGKFIKYKWGISLHKMFDTFLAEKVLRGGDFFGSGYSLDAVIAKRLGMELKIVTNDFKVNYDKKLEKAKKYMQSSFIELKKNKKELSEGQLAYAAQDVSAKTIIALASLQKKELKVEKPNIIYNSEFEQCNFVSEKAKYNYSKYYPKKLSLWPTALLEFKFLEVIIDLELTGIRFSIETHQKVLDLIKQDYDSYREEFLSLLGSTAKQKTLFGQASVNPDSNQQVLKALTDLGLSLEDTGADTLENLVRVVEENTKEHKILSALLGYRKTSKLLTAFGLKLSQHVHPLTKRIHVDVQQIIDTGRISNANPNLQQTPQVIQWKLTGDKKEDEKILNRPSFRDCFIPKDEYKFIIFDYSAQELRVAASVSIDKNMLQAFRDNKDLHSFSASLMYKEKYEAFVEAVKAEDKEAKRKRQEAKVVSFGSLYGSGPSNLSTKLHVSFEDAQEILQLYWEAYPDLAQTMVRFGQLSNRLGYSNTVLGRRRYYHDLKQRIKWVQVEQRISVIEKKLIDMNMEWLLSDGPLTEDRLEYAKSKIIKKYNSMIARKAGNHVIQGGSADITKLFAVLLYKDIKDRQLDAKIIGLIHDEIIVEVVEQEIEICKNLVIERMKEAMLTFCPNIPVEVEGKVSDCWRK